MTKRWTCTSAGLMLALASGVAVCAAIIDVPADQPSIAEAIAVAYPGDIVRVEFDAFNDEPLIDFAGRAIRVESTGDLYQPSGGLYLLAADSELVAPGNYLRLYGELRSPSYGTADAMAYTLDLEYGSRLTVLSNARLNIVVQNVQDMDGAIAVSSGGVLWLSVPPPNTVHQDGSLMLFEGAEYHISSNLDSGGTITALDATISAAGDINNDNGTWIMNGGRIIADEGLTNADEVLLTIYGGDLIAGGDTLNRGILRIFDGLVLAEDIVSEGYYAWNEAELSLYNTTLSALTLFNNERSQLNGSGDWFVDLTNEGQVFLVDNTSLTGDTVNTAIGTITIQAGTLTLFGSLTNDGTIIGDYQGPLRGDHADGLHIRGDYIVGLDAGLFMPGPEMLVRVDGDYDVAIDDNTRYDMLQSTLMVNALAGAEVGLELMSTDIGPSPAGLNRTLAGHYPVGTVRVVGATVSAADNHDNDGQGQELCEALYADTLLIDAGATLNTGGCRIYYNTLINDGTVTNPEDLIQILVMSPGDLDCDGDVDFDDIDPFVLALSGEESYLAAYPDCQWLNADCDNDGNVDFDDIDAFVSLIGL